MYQDQPSFLQKYGLWIFLILLIIGGCIYMTDKNSKSNGSNRGNANNGNGNNGNGNNRNGNNGNGSNRNGNNSNGNNRNGNNARKLSPRVELTNAQAAQIRQRQHTKPNDSPLDYIPPVVRPVDPSKVKIAEARKAPVEIKSSRQPLNVPTGPQDKLKNQIPEGDYWFKLFDRYLEPSAGRDKIENGWLVTKTNPSGVWIYKGNHLTFDFDGSPYGACLASTETNLSLACIGMSTDVQVCNKGRSIFVYQDGKVLFDGQGYLLVDKDGKKIHPQNATAFDIIRKG